MTCDSSGNASAAMPQRDLLRAQSDSKQAGGDFRGDRRKLITRWTAELSGTTRPRGPWPSSLRVPRRRADGFVILPAAFSDGRMSREAWWEVKLCLSRVRASSHPDGLSLHAVRPVSSDWAALPGEATVPIHATRVQIWQAIHRVHQLGTMTVSSGLPGEHVGVAIAADHRTHGRRRKP